MKYKSILIHIEDRYLDYNDHNVYHTFEYFHLQLVPFIIYYIIDLNLVS